MSKIHPTGKCIFCQGPVLIQENGWKAWKYCSKVCSKKFYKQRDKERLEKKRENDPYWIEKRKKIRERKDLKKARQADFEWHSDNWMGIPFFEKRGLTRGQVHARARALQLKNHRVGNPSFWSPEDAEKILNYVCEPHVFDKPIYDEPAKGYASREDVDKMLASRGIGLHRRDRRDRLGPNLMQQANNNSPAKRGLWLISDVTSYVDDIAASKQARESGWKQKRIEREKEKQEASKRFWDGVQKNKERRQMEKEEKERLFQEQNRCIVCDSGIHSSKYAWGRLPRYCSKECSFHERRLPAHIKKHELAPIEDLYVGNETTSSKATKNNENYDKYALHGIIQKFTCKSCSKEKPYTEFYRDRTLVCGRCISKCKECKRKLANERMNRIGKEEMKRRHDENYIQKFRIGVIHSIKRNIARATGAAVQIRVPDGWKYIEEYLGYTAEDFCKHLESQFDEKMHWGNHGQLQKDGSFRWQVDHIIPQSHYKYKSLEDPKLLECWDLSNIRPLDAKLNSLKGNKYDPENS
tara:strand:+ start:1898 stop:3469 length:1572 start_codon:yes stop_codon:yes gene_type:complete